MLSLRRGLVAGHPGVMSGTSAESDSGRELMLARLGSPLLVLVAVAASVRPGFRDDAWWHLASGRWMLAQRSWLREDVFSWTRFGEPWPRPGLIADIGMAAAFQVGGAPLLILLVASVFVSSVVLLLRLTESSPTATFAVGLLAVTTMASAATPRPLVLQLPLLVFAMIVLESERRRSPTGTPLLWVLPPLATAWVNLHGTYVILFVLIGCYGLHTLVDGRRDSADASWAEVVRHLNSRATRRLLLVGVFSLVGVLINPFGTQMLAYPIETLHLGASLDIHEWRNPALTDPESLPFFAILGTSVYAVVRFRSKLRPIDVILVSVFGLLGLTAYRHGPLFAAVAFPVTARLLSRRPHVGARTALALSSPKERVVETALLLASVAGVAVLVWPAFTIAGNSRADAEWFGAHAIVAVADGEYPQPIWNSYDQGTYLIWHGWPEVHVSMDSRADLYGVDLVAEHIAEWHGERDAPEQFADRGIRTVVVERAAPLVQQLEDAGWRRMQEDERAVILAPP
jgi:hypothetical protein